MKKVLFLLIAVLFCAGMASAEINYGMRMGVSLGNMALDPEFNDWGPDEADAKVKVGFYGGIWGKYMLNEKMGILAELNYVQKGDKFKFKNSSDDAWWIFWANELELPIMFYYMPMDKMILYAGPVLGYVISAGYNQKVDVEDPDIIYGMWYEMEEFVNRFDFSMAAGMRYDFTGMYFGELRFTYGFTDIYEEGLIPEIEAMNRTLTGGVGINL